MLWRTIINGIIIEALLWLQSVIKCKDTDVQFQGIKLQSKSSLKLSLLSFITDFTVKKLFIYIFFYCGVCLNFLSLN